MAASVNFKNLVRAAWSDADKENSSGRASAHAGSVAAAGAAALSPGDREAVRGGIADLVVRSPPLVRAQLCEALGAIAKADFPRAWPSLLPELVGRLEAAARGAAEEREARKAAYGAAGAAAPGLPSSGAASAGDAALEGVALVSDAVLVRYRDAFMTASLSEELEAVQALVRPLLAALGAAAQGAAEATRAARAGATDAEAASAAQAAAAAATPAEALALAAGDAQPAPGASAPAPSAREPLSSRLRACTLLVRAYASLNSPGMTDALEETLKDWMGLLLGLLALPEPPAAAARDADLPGPVDDLRSAVCEALLLLSERNEEEFAPYLSAAVSAAWRQLSTAGPAAGRDGPARAAAAFLAAVARRPREAGLFAAPGTLEAVLDGAIVPSLRMREDLEQTFETDWPEYLARDAEGADAGTRRRAALDLARALAAAAPARFPLLVDARVKTLLEEGSKAGAPDAWRAKDAALLLASALGGAGRTPAAGAPPDAAAAGGADVAGLFWGHVAGVLGIAAPPQGDAGAAPAGPDPAGAPSAEHPVLVADALRFALLFRFALPRELLPNLLAAASRELANDCGSVHSYAALLADKILAAKESDLATGSASGGAAGAAAAPSTSLSSAPLLDASRAAPVLAPLLERLFLAFSHPDSAENERVARALVRAVAFLGPGVAPVARPCLARLRELLVAAAANPGRPGFLHAAFEAAAGVVRGAGEAQTSAACAEACEAEVFPIAQEALAKDVKEFHPYVFQLLAQLLELRERAADKAGAAPTGLPPAYATIFPPLLAPAFWESPANAPGLSRLVAAYVAVDPAFALGEGRIQAVLGVFQKLLASRQLDQEALAVLRAVERAAPEAQMAPLRPTVWRLLMQRLTAKRTPRLARNVVAYACVRIAKTSPRDWHDAVEALGQGTAKAFVRQIWPGAVPAFASAAKADVKLAVVETVALLASPEGLRDLGAADPAGAQPDPAWGRLLDAVLALADALGPRGLANASAASAASLAALSAAPDTLDDDATPSLADGGVAFARLRNAGEPPERDELPTVDDARVQAAKTLAAGAAAAPGRVPALVAAGVGPEGQAKLQTWLQAAGVGLI